MARGVALALALLAGCSGASEGGLVGRTAPSDGGNAVDVEPTFRVCTTAERIELVYYSEHAAWRWQRGTGAAISYDCTDPNVWVEPAAIGDEPQWDEADGAIVLLVDPDIDRPDLATLHGLGHVLAGNEAHSESGAMAVPPEDLIDAASLELVCSGRLRCVTMQPE